MRSSADDVWMTYVPADDVRMTYMPADDVWMTYPPADDMQMMCRWCPDNICHPPAEISNEVSLSCHPHVVRASSARRPPRDFNPKIFPVKEQRTALLKIWDSLLLCVCWFVIFEQDCFQKFGFGIHFRFAVYGDFGNDNAQSLPRLQQEIQRGKIDAVLHVGDMAYDLATVSLSNK